MTAPRGQGESIPAPSDATELMIGSWHARGDDGAPGADPNGQHALNLLYQRHLRARGASHAPHATEIEGLALLWSGVLMFAGVGMIVMSVWFGGWCAAVALAFLGTSMALVLLPSSLGRRAIKRAGYRLCPTCRYSLGSMPAAGTCPECGVPYTHAEVELIWRYLYGVERVPGGDDDATHASSQRPETPRN